ncbi:hypothetical protein [Streptomyces sp. NPDC094468]|uniref:hypothetical protein n=1 Tax=Streptomyces sp. NPDC094468 TaxID=3366066 RepID=UPI00381EE47E
MSGHVKTARADHQAAALQARELPGQWVLAGTYGSFNSAQVTARQVRTGEKIAAYRPAGAYEPRAEITQDSVDLFVRYTGEQRAATSDFHLSVASGLTEDLAAFERRMPEKPGRPAC